MEDRRSLFGLGAMIGASGASGASAMVSICRAPSGIEPGPEPAVPPLKEGYITSGSGKLWYWDTGGAGPAVVVLHPGSSSGKIWAYQQQAFVDAGLRLIGYSRRGAAGSDPRVPADKTSDLDDLGALVDQLGLGRFHLLGTAAGAFIAKDYAFANPQRLKSLVIACSLLSVRGGPMEEIQKSLQMGALERVPLELRELSPSYRALNPKGTLRWGELSHGRADAMGPGSAPRGGPPGGAGAFPPGAAGGSRTLEGLRKLTMPTLLLAGEADLLAPPPLMQVFTRYLPRCEMVLLPECGHSGYWEAPKAFNASVIGFIKRTENRG